MPAISLASADDLGLTDALPAGNFSRARRPSTTELLGEAGIVAIERGFFALAAKLRPSWLYRQTLFGPIADHVSFYPDDPRAPTLEDANELMNGRFRLAGTVADIKQGSIFDQPAPSAEFAAALHGFEWLRHLKAAGGEHARTFALNLTLHWLKRNANYAVPAWLPEATADRLLNLLAHGGFFLGMLGPPWRAKFFLSLRDQTRVLARTLPESPDGLPRFKCAAALVVAGLCLADSRGAARGLKMLAKEIGRQIVPDGGHVSRSPTQLFEAFRVLRMVRQALDASGLESELLILSALERLARVLRFFRLGDGGLALFNGSTEGRSDVLSKLLEEGDNRPLAQLPDSGFHRLALGRAVVIVDSGTPPKGWFSVDAHAGCLSLEMSSRNHRMIVNCGAPVGRDRNWQRALRSTAAHSTLTLGEEPQATILKEGTIADLLGPRLLGGPGRVEARRLESAHGLTIEANHDAYVARFGVVHQRRMTLSRGGFTLTGADRLIPVQKTRTGKDGVPFAIRFHIHPDVRLSLAQGGNSVILKLPSGEGWRFRCGGGALSVEESIYFGSGSPRRAEQLVVSGTYTDQAVESAWVFEQVGSA